MGQVEHVSRFRALAPVENLCLCTFIYMSICLCIYIRTTYLWVSLKPTSGLVWCCGGVDFLFKSNSVHTREVHVVQSPKCPRHPLAQSEKSEIEPVF